MYMYMMYYICSVVNHTHGNDPRQNNEALELVHYTNLTRRRQPQLFLEHGPCSPKRRRWQNQQICWYRCLSGRRLWHLWGQIQRKVYKDRVINTSLWLWYGQGSSWLNWSEQTEARCKQFDNREIILLIEFRVKWKINNSEVSVRYGLWLVLSW